ncbi:MAG TPA: aromatic amino acid transport family protein [Chlamydiales bacterium]|nr:aromatic amino acid transport family protein [Chlamydiales bacterium]
MHVMKSHGHLLGATLLVAGTSIGVGILALPVATAAGGFLPSLLVYILAWLFMLSTGLLILEACVWHPKGSNLITLTNHLLGKAGKIACWILYLYLFYCLIVAHLASGGNAVHIATLGFIPKWLGVIIYTFLFAPVVYLGTLWVDRLNMTLMAGVIVTYLLFIITGVPFVDFSLLKGMHWNKAFLALPVVFTAFGYQNLVPTLVTYLKGDVGKVRFAILMGTMLTLVIYLIWQFTILGIIPLEGPNGLAEALKMGSNAVAPLGQHLEKAFLSTVGQVFAFFVMTTSFIGIAIAFVDFLADGLKVKKTGWSKLGICLLIFAIPMIITLINPEIFIRALSLAGGLGVALLLGIMPILMIWRGRYSLKLPKIKERLPGGKLLLIALFAFAILELLIEFVF